VDDNLDVVIITTLPYQTIGSHPTTPIRHVSAGFDWEQGKLLVWPETDIGPLQDEMKDTFKKMEKQHSELFLKNRLLENELKQLKGKP
jgi:hypothetical protein